MTVLGPVAADRLGKVMIHEHFTIGYVGAEWDPSFDPAAVDPFREGMQRIAALKERGVETIIDPLPMELGRDPELLVRLSLAGRVNIVCSTGMFHSANGFGVPFYWRVQSAEAIARMYLNEIENGIGRTGVRPGVIKIATGNPVSDIDRKVVTAAAMAAHESGLPVMSHCQDSTGATVQQDILQANGVDLARCLIGHLDGPIGAPEIEAIADRGSFVGIDRIGLSKFTSDPARVATIRQLIDDGYADRICVSQDKLCCLNAARFPFVPDDEHAQFLHEHVDHAFDTYLLDEFADALEQGGISRDTLDHLLIDNCRTFLSATATASSAAASA
jgi:phosphotriesterase-related protein